MESISGIPCITFWSYSNIQFFGVEPQQKLVKSFVIVVGLGGVGSHAASMLLRSGVGRLLLVDFDQVSLSSLNRHAVATRADVGTPKAVCLQKHFSSIFPECRVEAKVQLYDASLEEEILSGQPDFVLDCIDNIDTKVALLAACVRRGLKVLSAMGAGARADPTRIRMADLRESSIDPLSRSVRHRLRKDYGIDGGIPVVFSLEKPKVKLLPFKGASGEEENPSDYQIVPGFRVRIIPVLGTIPAIFGQVMASYVVTQLAGLHVQTEPVVNLDLDHYRILHQRLIEHEELLYGSAQQVGVEEVMYIVKELWHGQSARDQSNKNVGRKMWRSVNELMLVRWDGSKPASVSNLILLKFKEAELHESTTVENIKNEDPEYYDMVIAVLKRAEIDYMLIFALKASPKRRLLRLYGQKKLRPCSLLWLPRVLLPFLTMDRALVFSVLLLPCFLLLAAGESNSLKSVPDLEKAMYVNIGGYPCVRILNLSGELGCSNPGHGKVVAPVFRLENIHEPVTRVSRDPKFAENIAGVLIEASGFQNLSIGFSPAEKFPQAEFAPYKNISYKWNPHGSGIMWSRYNFPVFLLPDESSKLLQEIASENEKRFKTYPSNVAEFDLVMQTTKVETRDSASCLKERSCLPLGGYSVWSALPPINTTIELAKPIVLVVASMDSASFFRDLNLGADSPISVYVICAQGLIALLAAVDALSRVPDLDELKKQLVFVVFTGEAWGYLGSRRFLLELDLNADSVKGLNSNLIEQVLEIGSVGKGLSQGATTFFAHSEEDSSSTHEILDALQKASISLGTDNVKIRKADVSNPGLPPSSLFSFLKKNSSIPGVVLEDFDTSFRNKYYASHLDNPSNINSSSVAAAAVLVARALYTLASQGPPLNLIVLNSIKVNVSLVEELVGCLLTCEPGLSCAVVKSFITCGNVCPSHYVGVFIDLPSETQHPQYADDTSRFVWNFLADRTSAQQKNANSCKGECPGNGQVCVAAETDNSRCVTSTTKYVPAYSTRLKFESNSWQILPANASDPLGLVDPVWTESYWETIGLRVYRVQSSVYDNGVLLAGIGITFATYIAAIGVRTLLLKALKHD
ncbi:Nicastrin [Apostasia shenzhenica]|uniref:Nicastrin n=1 Tax=Apostasia shenzhenica TaxID=1088818 RepID=A0A2H9ZV80_9ASPA|nr:Nicastrin [Apostasia shenzhenica]